MRAPAYETSVILIKTSPAAIIYRARAHRCNATPPIRHGPYYQVSYTRQGKSSSKFVKKEDLPAVRKQLKNYERMKRLTEHWIDLATELSTLRLTKETS